MNEQSGLLIYVNIVLQPYFLNLDFIHNPADHGTVENNNIAKVTVTTLWMVIL